MSGTVLGTMYPMMNSLTWPPAFWRIHSFRIWLSSNISDLGRGWATVVRQDDVSLRRKLWCSEIPCQELSFISLLWFLICPFMSSDSEEKVINFQSDPKALQGHHYPYLFRNLARLPAPIPGVIHPLWVRTEARAHWSWCSPTERSREAPFDFCFSLLYGEID